MTTVWRVSVATLACLWATTAQAQVCVVCEQPSASYNCRIADDVAGKPVNDRLAQFACITELAKAGNHASCRVRRDFVPGCDAPERIVTIKGGVPGGIVSSDPLRSDPAKLPPGAKLPVDGGEGPPQTMAEVARRAAIASKDGVKKAGDAVGDTARGAGAALATTGNVIVKGVTCVFTLFLVCGEAPAKAP